MHTMDIEVKPLLSGSLVESLREEEVYDSEESGFTQYARGSSLWNDEE